jgi:hypothetical protein
MYFEVANLRLVSTEVFLTFAKCEQNSISGHIYCPIIESIVLDLYRQLSLGYPKNTPSPCKRRNKKGLAEGVGFEPTEHLSMLNGFQVLRRSCYPVRLVLSGAVLSRVSCYLVRLVLSCVIQFCLHLVYKPVIFTLCRRTDTMTPPSPHRINGCKNTL